MDSNPHARQQFGWPEPETEERESEASAPLDNDEAAMDSEIAVDQLLDENTDGRPADDVHDSIGDDREPKRQFSTLGRSLVFKGELVAEEDLLIQGRVEGSIRHGATNLTIGPHGSVKADIVGRRVIVQGRVVGDVRASESVIVEPSAHVKGDIYAPRVGLREGAKFKGRIDMDFDPSERATESEDAGASASKKPTKSRRQSK